MFIGHLITVQCFVEVRVKQSSQQYGSPTMQMPKRLFDFRTDLPLGTIHHPAPIDATG